VLSRFEKKILKSLEIKIIWEANFDKIPSIQKNNGETRKRKKRTSIDTAVRLALERAFNSNPKPTSEEIS
jgi:hypothetical protein